GVDRRRLPLAALDLRLLGELADQHHQRADLSLAERAAARLHQRVGAGVAGALREVGVGPAEGPGVVDQARGAAAGQVLAVARDAEVRGELRRGSLARAVRDRWLLWGRPCRARGEQSREPEKGGA